MHPVYIYWRLSPYEPSGHTVNSKTVTQSGSTTGAMSRAMILVMARFLVIALTTVNFAWAIDNCTLAGCGDPGDDTSVSGDYSTPSSPSIPGLDCDNWCNGCVSHVALANVISLAKIPTTVYYNTPANDSHYSRSASPPTHPPTR